MTARVLVQPDFAYQGVAVYLANRYTDGLHVVQPVTFDVAVQDEDVAIPALPSLRLGDDMARALLDALSAHYGGTGDTRSLRRDYDAERARVDKLLDAAIRRTGSAA